MIKISKTFFWEMGHRLTFHNGKCKNLHGHSYKARIIIEGELDKNGMLLDYYELKKIVNPFIDSLDHSFLVFKEDVQLIKFLEEFQSKYIILETETTAENICDYFLRKLKDKFPPNVKKLTVRIYETSNVYAEKSIDLN